MASVKIKFRASSVKDAKGVIFYQIIHNRKVRQIRTGYRIYENEWDTCLGGVTVSSSNERRAYLHKVRDGLGNDFYRLNRLIAAFEERGFPYEADEVVAAFETEGQSMNTLFVFMENVIAGKRKLGKVRTAETYAAAMNSFRAFMNGNDVIINNIDSDLMTRYEAYLRGKGIRMNSSSFYMRNLRAVYNRAVEKELTVQRFPFRHVYTGIEKTAKRAISINIIRKLKEMNLEKKPSQNFARDMFLFSFYTRGMAFVDMSYLKKKDLSGGILSYRRRKTQQQLFIKWEKCMQEIVDKYDTSESPYLLPVIRKPGSNDRGQYICVSHNINRNLKAIGLKLGLSMPLTMYVARHTWASAAKSKKIPLSVISEGMGHDSENTTRIYLASLDNMEIDKANSMILKSL